MILLDLSHSCIIIIHCLGNGFINTESVGVSLHELLQLFTKPSIKLNSVLSQKYHWMIVLNVLCQKFVNTFFVVWGFSPKSKVTMHLVLHTILSTDPWFFCVYNAIVYVCKECITPLCAGRFRPKWWSQLLRPWAYTSWPSPPEVSVRQGLQPLSQVSQPET